MLGFSGLLLWGAFRFLQKTRDTSAAICSLFVIAFLPQFINLSFSVMIGLPALSLAMLALVAQVHWHHKHSLVSLATSAVLLALSLLIKGFTFVLTPVLAAGLLLDRDDGNWRQRFSHLSLWSACFLAVFLFLLWVWVGFGHLEQLWLPHRLAQDLPEFRRMTAGKVLRSIQPLLVLAILGSWSAYRRREWMMLYPFAWMVMALVVLAGHKPVWPHQQLLVSIPAALLAVEPLRWIPQLLKQTWIRRSSYRFVLVGILLLAVVGIQIRRTYTTAGYWKNRATKQELEAVDWKLVEAMRTHAAQTRWMVTDRPIFAFRSGLSVPPDLAVISRKRVAAGLDDSEMLACIVHWRPEQVALLRFKWHEVRDYLGENYRRQVIDPDRELYLIHL